MVNRAIRKAVAVSFAATAFNFCILLREFFIGPPALRVGYPLSAVLRRAFRARMNSNSVARRSPPHSCCTLLVLLLGSIRRICHTRALTSIGLGLHRVCARALTYDCFCLFIS